MLNHGQEPRLPLDQALSGHAGTLLLTRAMTAIESAEVPAARCPHGAFSCMLQLVSICMSHSSGRNNALIRIVVILTMLLVSRRR